MSDMGTQGTWEHEWHGAMLQDRMGTLVALRTQAPSRPRCRNPRVSHWPHCCPHSLCHHPFPGHGKCQGRDGFWGAGWGARCAHPPALQSANPPPHTHPMSCPWMPMSWPTPCPTPLQVLSLPGHDGRDGSPPHCSALSAPGLASPSQPCYSALWIQDLLSRRKWKWSELSSALIPGLGLSTSVIPSQSSPKRANPGKELQGHHSPWERGGWYRGTCWAHRQL